MIGFKYRTSSPGYRRLYKKYQQSAQRIYREEGENLLRLLQQESYRGVSSPGLAKSWNVEVKGFSLKAYSDDPAARWKIAGRGPGRQPPVDALSLWAHSKGLNPWAVAISIRKKGTARWRSDTNFLNMDRNGKLRKPNPFEDARQKIVRRVSRLKFPGK
ncbi:MAG: hypothetical protein F6J87_14950 [Spirulina sp. SIO3F2]|nr:hypothetical protein [Spirulina sp. SIO3F2]